jgi:hypothetical protein
MINSDENEEESQSQEIVQDVSIVTREYGSQVDYVNKVTSMADKRAQEVCKALGEAFASAIRLQELEIIEFQILSVMDLGRALERFPIILKPLLTICNVAGRALERDLDLKNIDTYSLSLNSTQAYAIAGYIKPFLPGSLPLDALTHIDRVSYIDKEIRAYKGQWEKLINRALIQFSGLDFKKTKFRHGSQLFELDSAYKEGERVIYGVDVKRIEARRDIHKRIDEIVNKPIKLKEVYPHAKFGTVIYYPFITEQGNIRDRLSIDFIDSIQFAGESQQSVNQAVILLLGKFGVNSQESLL